MKVKILTFLYFLLSVFILLISWMFLEKNILIYQFWYSNTMLIISTFILFLLMQLQEMKKWMKLIHEEKRKIL